MITAIELPAPAAGSRASLIEIARRHGDYAIAGLAAVSRPLRLAYFGVGTKPIEATRAAQALAAGDLAGAEAALAEDLDPPEDQHGGKAMKLHLARVLLRRTAAALEGTA